MDVNKLVNAGITRNQAEVYLELLRTPGQSAGSIAKSLSKDRSFVYSILDSLKKRGLASYIFKERRTLFYPTDPENLLKEVDEKREKTFALVEQLKKIMPESSKELSVIVYEGKAGLKAYVRDFLESREFCTLGGGEVFDLFEELKYQYPQYLRQLVRKKIKGRLITSEKSKNKLIDLYKNADVQIKVLTPLESPVSFTVFGKKIAIYSAAEKPYAIIIDDEKISSALKAYFEILWSLNINNI
ncbi:MAG: hypothetical protein KAI53_02010 [Candidatus Aenigmarchaeota archaeon]|nr:hypothetical protein [Candidatus Aenigmarchaeota archaeon]